MINNTEYWKTLKAEKIIGRNAFPGEELFAKLPPGATVLDLGCGTGEMAEALSHQGYKVTGIDINEEAIVGNKARSHQVNYLVHDITQPLPFSDASFDTVVLSFVLVNIIPAIEREKLVAEITRILKPDGIVWLNEGLVSADYINRYELCRPFVKEDHDFFVFCEGISSSSVKNQEDLKQAIDQGFVARTAHHFTLEELHQLFRGYQSVSESTAQTSSPNSKSVITMTVMVLEKKQNPFKTV